jgi:GNAT superfamily N-acetyltransferase
MGSRTGPNGIVAGRPGGGRAHAGTQRAAPVGRVPETMPRRASRPRLHPRRHRRPDADRAGRVSRRRLRRGRTPPPARHRLRTGASARARRPPLAVHPPAGPRRRAECRRLGLFVVLAARPGRSRRRHDGHAAHPGPGGGGGRTTVAPPGRHRVRHLRPGRQRLAVDPSSQRRGTGRRLLLDGLAWMRDHGVRRAVVNTQVGNEVALALYLAVGFRQQPSGLSVLAAALA